MNLACSVMGGGVPEVPLKAVTLPRTACAGHRRRASSLREGCWIFASLACPVSAALCVHPSEGNRFW